jgi:Flp pilus assembly protein TadD
MEPRFPPAHSGLGLVHLYRGEAEEGVAALRRAHELDPTPSRLANLGYGLALSGRADDARRALAELEELPKERYVSPASIALVHVGLGENDRALAWLERAHRERVAWLFEGGTFNFVPAFDGLRADPRFRDLLVRFNLPQ